MNTIGKSWIVCRQHHNKGERFHREEDARTYAEKLARKLGGEVVEIFTCTSNLMAEIPVAVFTEPETHTASDIAEQ